MGWMSDRHGRKPVLVAGWIIGIPIPLLLIWAPTWGWVIFANVLLGVNQGLTWSATVIMKIDLVGPKRRGMAMGLNEAAGYGAVAVTAQIPTSDSRAWRSMSVRKPSYRTFGCSVSALPRPFSISAALIITLSK